MNFDRGSKDKINRYDEFYASPRYIFRKLINIEIEDGKLNKQS